MGSDQQRRRSSSKGTVLGVELRAPESFHLKRVECRLALEGSSGTPGEELHARLLLNDFCLQGAALFTARPVVPGSKAKLFLKEPRELALPGRILWSREYIEKKRVFTSDPHCFRLGFSFELAENSAELQSFCQELSQFFPGIDLTRGPFAA
jgi:hypothetical protein